MIKQKDLEKLLNGFGMLEYCGNLYFYIGTEKGKHFFQSSNDDTYITLCAETILKNNCIYYVKEV